MFNETGFAVPESENRGEVGITGLKAGNRGFRIIASRAQTVRPSSVVQEASREIDFTSAGPVARIQESF